MFWLILPIIIVFIIVDLVIASFVEEADDIGTPYFWTVVVTIIVAALSYWFFGDDIKAFLGVTTWTAFAFVKAAIAYVVTGVIFSFVKWYLFVRKRAEKIVELRETARRYFTPPDSTFLNSVTRDLLTARIPELAAAVAAVRASPGERRFRNNDSLPDDDVYISEYKAAPIDVQRELFEIAVREHVLRNVNQAYNYLSTVRSASTEDRARMIMDNEAMREAISPRALENKDRVSYWIIFWPLSAISTFFHEFIIRLADNIMKLFRGVYREIGKLAMRDILHDDAK